MSRLANRSFRLAPALLAGVVLLALGPALSAPAAGEVISIEDVSPDSSTLDPTDPDGATGGRVNGTAVDPNNSMVQYAASEWGGLYKSTDGGVNWTRLDGHRPVAAWDVEVDPSNSSRVYATSFFDGRSPSLSGINVSTDGGATWTQPATAVPPAAFCAIPADQTELTAFGIGIDPTNNAQVFIGTSCGMAVSTDSGVTWSFTSPVVGASRIWDLVVSANGNWVDTCGDAGHHFYNIGAGTWGAGSGLPSGRCSIAASPYSPANDNMFAVVGTTIYETENAGGTWTNTRTNPSPQGRIPFVETNMRSTAPAGTIFDLWFGDVSLHSVTCDTAAAGANCGTGTTPPWSGPFTRSVGGHDDMGSILFDPAAANDACPILMSSDGGVYRNLESTSPGCQTPTWEQPTVSPHGLWPWALHGADRAGATDEDLYFGNQDNGVFGATDAGAAMPTWENEVCCDGFDTAADDFNTGAIVYSICCFGGGGRRTRFFKKGAGFTGGGEINYPGGGLPPDFQFPDAIVNWDDKKYAMVTRNCTPGVGGCPGADGGVFITEDADATPIVWTELGNATEPPSFSICGIKAGTSGGVPTFYVQTGSCNADVTTDRMFKFTGTNPAGTWTELFLPSGGFGIFAVSESDPNMLLASGFTSTDALMYKSTDGGATWTALTGLDTLMRGGSDFPIKNDRGPTNFTGMNGYHQPSLVAIDPTDPNIMVAGGRDSGVFLSTDAGATWSLVTDPRNSHTSGTPHIPRPWHAYFDEEPGGSKKIYLSSQGRGVWRLTLAQPCLDDGFEDSGSDGTDDMCFGASLGTLPATQTHAHCDEDWVWFNAEQGKTYLMETANLTGQSDTTLALHLNCGPELLFDDDGGLGLASLLLWTANAFVAADLRLRQFADDYQPGEGYDITVSEICLADLVLTDQTVSGPVSFVADNSITTGPDFLVTDTGSATLTTGNTVVMLNGTAILGELTVELTPSPCQAGPTVVFTTVGDEVGKELP